MAVALRGSFHESQLGLIVGTQPQALSSPSKPSRAKRDQIRLLPRTRLRILEVVAWKMQFSGCLLGLGGKSVI